MHNRVHIILNVLKRIYYYSRYNSIGGGGMLNYSNFEIGTLV